MTGVQTARATRAAAHRTAIHIGFTTLATLSRDDDGRWSHLAAQRLPSAPLVDTAWVRSWMEAFVPREPLLLAARDRRDLVGLAALQRVASGRKGRPGVLQSLTNEESFRFDFLSWGGRIDILEGMWRVLCDGRHWNVIHLQHVPGGSPTLQAARTVARELGWRVVARPTFLSPWRRLSGRASWDDGLARNFRSNLRRRGRRLEELGKVHFEVVRGGGVQQALDLFYRLELNGWKGRSGTAIAQRPRVKQFYDRLVQRAAWQGGIWIPLLTVAGTPVAAQVLRVCGHTIFGLKTAYHEAFAKYGPGQLLTARVMRYGLEHGMEALDMMAANAGYKTDWGCELRPHYDVMLFAPRLAGRYAYWVGYGIPGALKRLPGAVRMARWVASRRNGRTQGPS